MVNVELKRVIYFRQLVLSLIISAALLVIWQTSLSLVVAPPNVLLAATVDESYLQKNQNIQPRYFAGGTFTDTTATDGMDSLELGWPADVTEVMLTPMSSLPNTHFGHSVAINEDVILIGAPNENEKESASGAVYVYRHRDGQWLFETKWVASEGQTNQRFGHAIALSDEMAIVGAVHPGGQGAAYLYRQNEDEWQVEAKLEVQARQTSEHFGHAVAIHGDFALVGAYGDDTLAEDAGMAYLFRWDGEQWRFETSLTASDGQPRDQFGWSVAIHNKHLLIGAPGKDALGMPSNEVKAQQSGMVYLFSYNDGRWSEQAKWQADEGHAFEQFGYSVDISQEQAIVGATYFDQDVSSGMAYIYHLQDGEWQPEARLRQEGGGSTERFGETVAIGDQIALVGAPGGTSTQSKQGSVYFYRWRDHHWQLVGRVTKNNDTFGQALALENHIAVVGTSDEVGNAFIYNLAPSNPNEDSILITYATPTPTLPPSPTLIPKSTIIPSPTATFTPMPATVTPIVEPSKPPENIDPLPSNGSLFLYDDKLTPNVVLRLLLLVLMSLLIFLASLLTVRLLHPQG